MKFDLKDVCFFDYDTTGIPANGLKWDADFECNGILAYIPWRSGNKI